MDLGPVLTVVVWLGHLDAGVDQLLEAVHGGRGVAVGVDLEDGQPDVEGVGHRHQQPGYLGHGEGEEEGGQVDVDDRLGVVGRVVLHVFEQFLQVLAVRDSRPVLVPRLGVTPQTPDGAQVVLVLVVRVQDGDPVQLVGAQLSFQDQDLRPNTGRILRIG